MNKMEIAYQKKQLKQSPLIDAEAIFAKYDLICIDAYGVLVDHTGALPGANRFMQELQQNQIEYLILTNDASNSLESCESKYKKNGFVIPAKRIITSASLIGGYYRKHRLVGAQTLVMGTEDTKDYARKAGAQIVEPTPQQKLDILIVGDEAGYPLLETIDHVITILIQHYDRGERPRLLLPNPDLIYPKSAQSYGITSGSIVCLIEAVLEQRYGEQIQFHALGKPNATIFQEALQRYPAKKPVMIGDQLHTDILGANRFGIDSILSMAGLTKDMEKTVGHEYFPTYRLAYQKSGVDSTR